MRKIRLRPYIRSFSFRVGLAIFVAMSALLLGQRVLIYQQTIDTALEDVQLIIDAHKEEMDEEVELHGISYLEKSLNTISEGIRDKHLYMLLRRQSVLTGNLVEWPAISMAGKEYAEVTIQQKDEDVPLHLLVSVSEYPQGAALLVGYDLERVDAMRDGFVDLIINNFLLSFAISLFISTFIVWLLVRYFRGFNQACNMVMNGNIDYRIHTYGTNDEFDKLANNINRMLDWIKSLLFAFKDSSNAIAHDMRTPLSRLRLELRALAERPLLNEETRLAVAEHVGKVDELIAMFENILNIAKAETRTATELFERVDFRQLVKDAIDFYQPIYEDKHLQLILKLPDQPMILRGDKQLLGQAVVNLIDNACKYTPEHGTIDVRLTEIYPAVTLVVADNGAGIPKDFLEKAKERFFRLDESRNTSGHGLGLSLVNAVAGLHQGNLVLEDNDPGLKATFMIQSESR